jgi:hypothetical protein
MSDTTRPAQRHYPLPRPDHDPRFCIGLAYDVAKVLAAYGYPPVTSGGDFMRLQQHLFQAIYQQKEETL